MQEENRENYAIILPIIEKLFNPKTVIRRTKNSKEEQSFVTLPFGMKASFLYENILIFRTRKDYSKICIVILKDKPDSGSWHRKRPPKNTEIQRKWVITVKKEDTVDSLQKQLDEIAQENDEVKQAFNVLGIVVASAKTPIRKTVTKTY